MTEPGSAPSLRDAAFNVVTLATSCGFGNAQGAGSPGDFVLWVPAAQVVLFSFMWSGGMTGSTSGGIKVLRVQVMGRLAWREMLRVRRRAFGAARSNRGRVVVDEETVARVAGFVLLYFVLAVVSALVLTFSGTDIMTSISGTVSRHGQHGSGRGRRRTDVELPRLSPSSRMILALLMLVGRLEVFPVVLAGVALVRGARPGRRLPKPTGRGLLSSASPGGWRGSAGRPPRG